MDYKNIFPKRLKETRISRGKSQEQMAIALNISRPSYTTYETGKSYPKFENLMKIAEELNISIDYLVGLSETATNPSTTYNINQHNNKNAVINIGGKK
jgi:transcriptional regulator with XRE-family HTH domain